MSDTTGGDGDAKSVVKFILFRGTIKAFSGFSVEVSTSGANVEAFVVDDDLSRFTLLLEDTFSSVHKKIVFDTLSASSSFLVVNLTELIHFVAEVVVTQILSWWTLAWIFDLKTDSV